MKKGRLKVNETEPGKLGGSITLADGSATLALPHWFRKHLKKEWDGSECEILKRGEIEEIIHKEIKYTRKGSFSVSQDKVKKMHSSSNRDKANRVNMKDRQIKINYAVAPYNFIPLNAAPVLWDRHPVLKKYGNDENQEKHITGRIEYDLIAKTPLYIRDTITEEKFYEDMEKAQEDNHKASEDAKASQEEVDFFSPGSIYKIPGSSIRGMVRSLVEIVSYGKFDSYDTDRIYCYRSVGDTSSLGAKYRDMMVDQQDDYKVKIKTGWIIKRPNGEYAIKPSKVIKGTQIYRVDESSINGHAGYQLNKKTDTYHYENIYFVPVESDKHEHSRSDRKTNSKKVYYLKYAKVTDIIFKDIENGETGRKYEEGCLIVTGVINKKHMHWIINMPDKEKNPLKIPSEVIKKYNNDDNRTAENVLNHLDILIESNRSRNGNDKKDEERVPCFYLTDDDEKIIYFGHTGMFRLAYNKTVADHVPVTLQQEKDSKDIDLAEAIFGKEAMFASRVSFEDIVLDDKKDSFIQASFPRILSSPKPTTFQHYLNQGNEPDRHELVDKNNLKDWDSDNYIRGYKMYWHKNIDYNDWIVEDLEDTVKHPKQYPIKIKPVVKGSKFLKGVLRFENLTEIELGALLFVLDLPDGLYHKIGMGKPLGLGSVKIKPILILTDRKKRYTKLFDNNRWYLPEMQDDKNNYEMEKFKESFARYMLCKLREMGIADCPKNVNDKATQSFWELDRMKQLKTMLDWKLTEKPKWQEETRYMKTEVIINGRKQSEYANRSVLPLPVDVADK